MKRIKRTSDFEISLAITNPDYALTPRPMQRSWFVNRALKECAEELVDLEDRGRDMIAGAASPLNLEDRETAKLDAQDIMEDWQLPVMEAMAEIAAVRGGDVLEIGFGRGIASNLIQLHNPNSHTVIDCNPHIAATFDVWKAQHGAADIRLIEARWEETVDNLPKFDGIFFHAYPLTNEEFLNRVVHGVTFAADFFPVAGELLKPGGSFTYFTNEADSLSRAHQRQLLKYFDQFSIHQIKNLEIPDHSRDSHWSRKMVIVEAALNANEQS